jgi:hypothetical protein
MDLREIGLGGCGLDSTGLGQGPVAGCCECGDEPLGSCATELVSYKYTDIFKGAFCHHHQGYETSCTSTTLHGAISQKVIAAVKTGILATRSSFFGSKSVGT